MSFINFEKFAGALTFAFSAILKQENAFISVTNGKYLNLHTTKSSMFTCLHENLDRGEEISIIKMMDKGSCPKKFVESVKSILGGKPCVLLYAQEIERNETYFAIAFNDLVQLKKQAYAINFQNDYRLIGCVNFMIGSVLGEANLLKLIKR